MGTQNTDLAVLRVLPVEGRRQATATEVKEWGRENGFTVPAVQGRLSNDLIDAFNAQGAKGREAQRVQYVQGSAHPAAREFNYLPEGARKPRTFTATLAEVRTWANANGHTVADRGRIAQEVIEAYGVAHEKPRAPRKSRKAQAAPEVTGGE